MLRSETRRVRGGPVFVESGDEIITLVPEVTVRELRFGDRGARRYTLARVKRVFVIDADGVRPVTMARPLLFRVLLFAALALGPLLFVLSVLWRTRGARD